MGKAKKRQSAGIEHHPARVSSADVRLDRVCLGLVLTAASVLLLSNLGNVYLWGDEAATALVSKTILSHGIPMGSDGTNYFSQLAGAECTKNMVWVWHPWFPFYLLAGFYALLGVSTVTARLPFALLGIATVGLAFCFGKSLWKSRQAGVYSAAVLLVSVPFLILVRQCRYYSPEIFLSLLGLYGCWMLQERRKHALVVFGVSAFLLFHTQYVQCAALLGAVIIHSLIFRRDRVKPLLAISAAVLVLNIPWIILFSGLSQVIGGNGNLSGKFISAVGVYGMDIGRYVFHPSLLLLPALIWAGYWNRNHSLPARNPDTAQKLWLLGTFAVLTVVGAALTGQDAYFRYIGPVIPVACLVIGLILASISRVHVAASVVLLVGIAAWLRMPAYLSEITGDYNGPAKGISAYLNQYGRDTDVVAVNHEDLPVKFYTTMRVVSGVTGEPWSDARNADWIVLRCHGSSVERRYTYYLARFIRSGGYQRIELDCPDIPFENREEPSLHNFRTVTDAPKVVIFRRVSER